MIQALPKEVQDFENLVSKVFNRRRRISGTNWSSSELQKLFVETTKREQAAAKVDITNKRIKFANLMSRGTNMVDAEVMEEQRHCFRAEKQSLEARQV